MQPIDNNSNRRPWPDYRAVWRWHFYAGLFCIPFVIILSATGAVYLFKPQIESWIDRDVDQLTMIGGLQSPANQASAAIQAFPGSKFQSYEIPATDHSSARVVVVDKGKPTRVYVHPSTLEILKSIPEESRPMRVLFKIHGELLMGNRGSALVELAASWTIVMILTGLYLWWPRKARGLGGILYPRFGVSSRTVWRDIHSVSGFWISGFTLILLLSGLPWAKFWGDYLKRVRHLTGTAVAQQDWSNGSTPPVSSASGEHSDHNAPQRRSRDDNAPSIDLTSLDRIVATVRSLALPHPVVVARPGRASPNWTAKSMTPNRPHRVDIELDAATGAVLSRKNFEDRHLIDRVVGYGIAVHEGQLFGWPNQLLGLLTATGLVGLCVSSVVLWWRRRDPGVLGAPSPAATPRFSPGLFLILFALALYLPLFAASLLAMLALERLVLRRIPRARHWLGLAAP